MVVVQVRDQHRIKAFGDLGGGGLGVAAKVRHAGAQHRIGEQPDSVQLDQNGGVPAPRDTVGAQETIIVG